MLLEAAWISPNVRALLFHGLNDGTSCDLREVHESLLRSPSETTATQCSKVRSAKAWTDQVCGAEQ